MRQGGPARIYDAVFPLAEDFHPRIHVELEIMARGTAPPEEWSDGQETGCSQQQRARDRSSEQSSDQSVAFC
jgi:hypothetical protein